VRRRWRRSFMAAAAAEVSYHAGALINPTSFLR